MFRLNSEQLSIYLKKRLNRIYLLIGNDPLLLKESKEAICCAAEKQGFSSKSHTFQVRNHTDWEGIFSFCRERNLFFMRQILHIEIFLNSHNIIDINKKISILTTLLHNDLILILEGNYFSKMSSNLFKFSQFPKCTVMVSCHTPERRNLLIWITNRAKKDQLQIEESACKLLCYYYEGNLLALSQTLNRLLILWPDKKLTFSRVEQAVNDSAHFLPIHWVDSLLEADIYRALRILQRLYLEDIEPIVLLRLIQRKLLLLLTLKRKPTNLSIGTLLNKYHVQVSHRVTINKALIRLNKDQLRKSLQLLTFAELLLRQNYKKLVWMKLESLSLLLCQESLKKTFSDN